MSDAYETAAHFAQSWGLLYFFLIFVAVVVFVMRPSVKARYEDASRLPIREDD